MPEPHASPLGSRTWIVLGLGVLGLGALGLALARPPATDRVLILNSRLDNRGSNLGPGMEALIEDHLEVLAGATVTQVSTVPNTTELKRLPSNTQLLRFEGHREGDLLHLAVEWNTASRLMSGKAWTRQMAVTQEPARAMQTFVGGWPLKVKHRILHDLVPRTPVHFWALLEAMAILDDREATAHLEALQQLADEEPQCATVWTTLGDHLYRSLWIKPEAAGVGLSSRTHRAFQRAVNLVPGHPRATFLWSMMLTDTGNQDAALKALEAAARLRPGTPELYFGFAYAGRTAGLLEGARRALARRKALLGSLDEPSAWFAETTYLYLGDLEAFRQELQRAGSFRQDASIFFYQGYFALLQGHPHEALGFMKAGSTPGMVPAPFNDLCRVYLAYLEGRPRDGLAELHEVDEVRGKLRIPDGEWTFKEAEAYSLLGDADRGVDCATRAFVQGFSCSAWYEASPFLAKVRAHARWPMLRRNIRERQAVMEGSFPAAVFDP